MLTTAITVFAVAVTEVLTPEFTDPAAHRLADTVLGAAIAILIGYVLVPARGRLEEGKRRSAPARAGIMTSVGYPLSRDSLGCATDAPGCAAGRAG